MAISLVVLLIPLALVVAVFRLRGGEDVVVVDPGPAISQAAGAFTVSVPKGLGDGWKPVTAQFHRETGGALLRVGYVTPGGGGVQLVESTEPVDGLLIRELGDQTRPTGTVAIGGLEWRSYDVRGDERALVRTEDGRTLIVIGQADAAELHALAAALG
jgi:Protein of unknown function (DUF4245)